MSLIVPKMHRFSYILGHFLRENTILLENCEKTARKIPPIFKFFCIVIPNRCRQKERKGGRKNGTE